MLCKVHGVFMAMILAVVASFAAPPPASASVIPTVLDLNLTGTTAAGTTLNGNPIDPGTVWSLTTEFDSTTVAPFGQGVGRAPALAITGLLGTTPFTLTYVTGASVMLGDPSNSFSSGYYFGGLVGGKSAIWPLYTASSASGWDPLAPTPTQFSGFGGFVLNLSPIITNMDTDLGKIDLSSNSDINATISGVPEPSTYALLCISLGVVGYARKKMMKREG